MRQIALSEPRANTSRRPSAPELTSGPDASVPPSHSHADHAPPLYHLCHNALSVAPLTKTSIRPELQDTAVGSPVMPAVGAPSDSQVPHVPVKGLCHNVPPTPVAKTSRRFAPHDDAS